MKARLNASATADLIAAALLNTMSGKKAQLIIDQLGDSLEVTIADIEYREKETGMFESDTPQGANRSRFRVDLAIALQDLIV